MHQVCGLLALAPGDAVDTVLDVAAGDGNERTSWSVTEIEAIVAAIGQVGGLRVLGVGGDVIPDGVLEGMGMARASV